MKWSAWAQILLDPFLNTLSHMKMSHFDILMTVTPEVNMITRQMTLFSFLIYSLSSICCYISFLDFKTFKIQFDGLPLLHYVLACKIHMYMPEIILSSLLILISFFYMKFANFWYKTCFIPYLISISPWSYGQLSLLNCR